MAYADEVLADSPVLYWRLNETTVSTGSTVADSSGNGYTGQITGTAFSSVTGLLVGDADTAIQWPPAGTGASQAQISRTGAMGTIPNVGTTFTIEAVVKTTTTTGSTRPIASRRGAAASTSLYEILLNLGKPSFYMGGSAQHFATSPTSIADGNPHHIAGVFSSTDNIARLYVDGTQVATATIAGYPPAATPSFIAGTDANINGPFVGTIDEVALYATALSPARIAAHSTASKTAPATKVNLAGTATAASAASGSLRLTKALAGTATAASSTTGGLRITRALVATATAAAAVTGSLSVAGRADLFGDAIAAASASGTLTVTRTLTATATAASAAAGTLVSAVPPPVITAGTEQRNLDARARRRTGQGFVDITVPVAPEPPTITAAPIRVVVDTLPAPNVSAGAVAPMVPTVLRETEWGRIRVAVSYQDVTYLRDKPAQVVDYQLLDPYGYGPATLRFPQVTFWELPDFGAGALSWLRKNAPVHIHHVQAGTQRKLLWLGHIDAFDFDDDGALLCDCSGELVGRMDKTHRTQRLVRGVNDAGSMARIAASIPNRTYRLNGSAEDWGRTGIPLENTGGGMGTNLAFLDHVLANAVTADLESWTILPMADDPRRFDLVMRDRTTVHATVYLGARGVSAQLRDDQLEQPNRMFGEGVAPSGARWRGAEYPNLGPETVPTYPFTDGRTFGTVGLGNEDTDTGDGISVLEHELLGSGLLDVSDRDGVWSLRTTEAIEEVQRRAGLPVTGQVDPATWTAVWGDGNDQQRLSQARIHPLVWRTETERWLYSPNGSVLGRNPNQDRRVPQIERMVSFGEGVSKRRARRWLRREMNRANGDNWRGTITLSSDLLAGEHTFGEPGTPLSRMDLRAGQNIRVKRFGSANGMLMHIASVQVSGLDGDSPQVQLAVDTQARDAITLAEMLERDKAARLDPARRWLNQHRRSAMPSDALVGWDREAGAGVVRHTRLVGGQWNVVPVIGGQAGEVQRVGLTTTNAPAAFVCAVFARPIREGELNHKVGDPFVDYGAGETIWTQDEVADMLAGIQTKEERERLREQIRRKEEQRQTNLTELTDQREERIADMFALLSDTRAGVYVAGTTEAPCGYWPGSKTDRNGNPSGDPITGRWREDASFSYWTLSGRSPWLYLAVWPDRDTTISGRMYDQLIEGA